MSLFDSTSLIVGIIIGAGIYQMAPDVAKGAGSILGVSLIWIVGGIISLCGALGYAELASMYPREGGDYVYLTRAYGPWAGFLFGWIQLAIVRPGDIAVMAFAFATYGKELYNPFPSSQFVQVFYAGLAIVLLTLINISGVRQGKWTQNFLTVVKALGLIAIFAVALLRPPTHSPAEPVDPIPFSVALILVLFTYGGWNEMAYVAAEVRRPERNIIRSLVLGTAAVTILYLLANGAFLYALGYDGMTASKAVATDTVKRVFPALGAHFISALICISALGAVNGLIFTGARISYAVGADHRVFHFLGQWNLRTQTPVSALLIQGILALLLVMALGSFLGAIMYTAAAVYSFYLATSIAVLVLRRKESQRNRPYKVTVYPLPTVLFCTICIWLIYSAVTYRPLLSIIPLLIFLAGIPLYRWSASKSASATKR
ncbi:MAG: amino acid permease [Planctomycetes bacterium]|nr:amino acid permease [Planctomycetota bacterium]